MGLKVLFYSPILQKARWEAWRFGRCCQRTEEVQRKVLAEKLKLNGSSGMGRLMGVPSLTSLEEFRSRVPITAYDHYADAIEKCKNGDSGEMAGQGQQIIMFALSSGTSGKPKSIPITHRFLTEYRRGWLAWGYYAYSGNAELVETLLLPIISSASENRTPAGIPCGAISGLTVECQNWITKHLFAVPKEVYKIGDLQTKYYLLGRFAIEKKVGSISSANPSTVLAVFRLLNQRRNQIIEDVRKGGLDGAAGLSQEDRCALQSLLKPNPRRAAELENLASEYGGLYPKHFWKHLSLVSNWKGGSLGRYLDFYPEFFGNAQIRDIGLIASEGRMTIPLSADGSDGVLDVMSHFFEFIPEEQGEDKTPKTLLAHQLEKGKRYFILLTTSSGFYRYDIRDLVEVTGFYHQAPVLRFLNKGKHISSITGEKISEYQVVQAVGNAARQAQLRLEDYTMFPKWDRIPRYGLLVEEGSVGDSHGWGAFLRQLDIALRRLNCEYDSKRCSGRLGGVSLFFVPAGTFGSWKADKIRQQGGRVEQYKHVFLVPDQGFESQFPVLREFSIRDLAESRLA